MADVNNQSFFRVKDVDLYFGAMAALRDVGFEVEKGSVFGIAGPNGAGKTTLLNVISGALRNSKGSIHLEGEKISGLKAMSVCHKGVARIFQIPVVFPTLTVLENIKVGNVFGHASGKPRERDLQKVIDLVKLGGSEHLPAENIDLYSRKRLMLAAALATSPKLLLLDEPLGGLNFSEIEDFLKMVKALNKDMGITIIIIEHLFDKLIELSDNIMILDFGRPIYLGPADRVAQDPTVIEVYLGMKQHA